VFREVSLRALDPSPVARVKAQLCLTLRVPSGVCIDAFQFACFLFTLKPLVFSSIPTFPPGDSLCNSVNPEHGRIFLIPQLSLRVRQLAYFVKSPFTIGWKSLRQDLDFLFSRI
jgi:hypothetical protein